MKPERNYEQVPEARQKEKLKKESQTICIY
jgi:hypothetical protein